MRTRAIQAAILTASTLPLLALAAPPPEVTGLVVEAVDEGIELLWNESNDNSVARYRVCYSTESILDNEGTYDGCAETDGPDTEYIFAGMPEGQKLFVSVLAVNNAGEPSEYFAEEVSFVFFGSTALPAGSPLPEGDVPLPRAVTGNQPYVPMDLQLIPDSNAPQVNVPSGTLGEASSTTIELNDNNQPVTDPNVVADGLQIIQERATNDGDLSELYQGNLMLLNARALSPTRVSLEFSHFISIAPEVASQAFRIVESDGTQLPIRALSIDQADVILETAPQEAGTTYEILVSEPLVGVPNLPLDTISRSAFFSGHSAGGAPVTGDILAGGEYDVLSKDVAALAMQAVARADGLYDVQIQWVAQGKPSWFVVRQTRDDGLIFSPPSRLPATYGGVQLQGVQPGRFGVAVQTLGSQGDQSTGMIVNATLPANNRNSQPIYATGGPLSGLPPIDLPDDIAPVPNDNDPNWLTPCPNDPSKMCDFATGQPIDSYPVQPDLSDFDDLTDSGPGIAAALIAAGAFTGWRRGKKRAAK